MKIHTDTLPNGIRLLHVETRSEVMYCGAFIAVGTRDELPDEHGMAHLMEHMLFKGTARRTAAQINDRLEGVGGELNAYTSKEETVVYAMGLKRHFARAYDLVCDLVFHCSLAQDQLVKERAVVMDEIDSYKDDPADLIADDFEELMFPDTLLGRPVLGTKKSLRAVDARRLRAFYERVYTTDRMVLFSMGSPTFDTVKRLALQCTEGVPASYYQRPAELLPAYAPGVHRIHKRTSQLHCLLGTRALSVHDAQRDALLLLNNLLGGPSMNSRLGSILREKNGLVYTVESQYVSYSDTGLWSVYFGADAQDEARILALIRSELDRLMQAPITPAALRRAQVQYLAQLTLAAENKENWLLALVKQYVLKGQIEPEGRVAERVRAVSAEAMLSVAQQLLAPDRITTLLYV